MKMSSMRADHNLIGMVFMGTLMLISVAAGGCMDQARSIKDQHALILEKAEQDRAALDDLIKLSMKECKAAKQRYEDLQCSDQHMKEQLDQVQVNQSNLHNDLNQLKACVQEGFNGIRTLLAERFSQARQAQLKNLALQQQILDRVQALSDTVGPLPDRTLSLESRQERLMQAMEQHLNEVMAELHQVRQENQQLSQANAALTLAVQGVAQNVDLVHKRQDVLVDLIEAKGEGVNTQLGQLAVQQGQVHEVVEGVHAKTEQIAQDVQQVNDRQAALTQAVEQGSAQMGEQLQGLGEQNGRQLALQRRLNKAVQEANGSLLTLQKAGAEFHELLDQSRTEDHEQWVAMNEQQKKTQVAVQTAQQGLHDQVEAETKHLNETLGRQNDGLQQKIAEGQQKLMDRLETLSDQQAEQSKPVQAIMDRVRDIESYGGRLVHQVETTQSSLEQIQGTLAETGQQFNERLDEVRQGQTELTGQVEQGQKRLDDGMQDIHERSVGWAELLTQLNRRADTLQDQIAGFEKQINATAEALKLQTNALEHHQQAQTQSGVQQDSTQQTLTTMNHALGHIRDLQVALQEQLANVRLDLKKQEASLNQTLQHLERSPVPSSGQSPNPSPAQQENAPAAESSIEVY